MADGSALPPVSRPMVDAEWICTELENWAKSMHVTEADRDGLNRSAAARDVRNSISETILEFLIPKIQARAALRAGPPEHDRMTLRKILEDGLGDLMQADSPAKETEALERATNDVLAWAIDGRGTATPPEPSDDLPRFEYESFRKLKARGFKRINDPSHRGGTATPE